MVVEKFKVCHRLRSYVLQIVSYELRGVSYDCILLFLLSYHTLKTYREEDKEKEVGKERRDEGEMRKKRGRADKMRQKVEEKI